MAQQTINIGASPNDGTGDKLRTAGDKINDNFTEVYAGLAAKIDDSQISSFALTYLDDVDAAEVRATLGVGTGSGDMLASNNLSDLANAATARTNLGLNAAAVSGGYEARTTSIPLAADFTWINQGTATASDGTRGLVIVNDNDAENHLLVKAAPTAPYDVYMRVENLIGPTGNPLTQDLFIQYGIALRDSSDGEFITLSIGQERTGAGLSYWYVRLLRWTNPTTFSATIASYYQLDTVKWLRVNVTSTTITFYYSIDGLDWVSLGTETIATFVDTVSQIGVCVRANANTATSRFKVQYFSTTAPD